MTTFYQLLAFIFFVLLAALFAGAEIGAYQLSRLRLRIGLETASLPFLTLAAVMQDTTALVLSMLIGTNLSHYIATSIITYIFLKHAPSAHSAEFYATIVAAPIFLVFAELIPKNLFYFCADYLMPRISPFLWFFNKLFKFTGIIKLLKFLSSRISPAAGSTAASKKIIIAAKRSHLRAIMRDIHEEAILSPIQTGMIDRLMNSSNIPVTSAMTPISHTRSVPYAADRQTLLAILEKHEFTHLPVYKGRRDNITGFINIYDCLCCETISFNLKDFSLPIHEIPFDTPLVDAAIAMSTANHKIAIITKPHHNQRKAIGIVTQKTLIADLFGELSTWPAS